MAKVLKFRTLVACQDKAYTNRVDPDQTASSVFPIYYSDKHL